MCWMFMNFLLRSEYFCISLLSAVLRTNQLNISVRHPGLCIGRQISPRCGPYLGACVPAWYLLGMCRCTVGVRSHVPPRPRRTPERSTPLCAARAAGHDASTRFTRRTSPQRSAEQGRMRPPAAEARAVVIVVVHLEPLFSHSLKACESASKM